MENTHINESILSEEILEDQKKNRIDHMTYLPGMEDIGSEIMDQVISAMEEYDYSKYTAADVKNAISRRFYLQQRYHFWKKLHRPHSWKQENILEIVFICLLRSILQIIVRIIVFIVDSTVTTKLTVHN